MIEAGDLVRVKNKFLSASSGGIFAKYRKRTLFPKMRGKQVIARVLRVISDEYDWRSRRRNRIVELDVPDVFMGRLIGNKRLSTEWLVIHRKAVA